MTLVAIPSLSAIAKLSPLVGTRSLESTLYTRASAYPWACAHERTVIPCSARVDRMVFLGFFTGMTQMNL